MNVSIITIGDEIVNGAIVDTNSKFLSEQLYLLGYNVVSHMSVCDDIISIGNALDYSCGISNLIFVVGGLGPTKDDVTREAVAKFLNRKLTLNNDLLNDIKNMFAKSNYKMSPSNRKQAMVIENSTVIYNDHGTAPGIHIIEGDVELFVLPGPPYEIKKMFEKSVVSKLKCEKTNNLSKMFRVIGIGESSLEEKIYDVIDCDDITYGIYANGNLVDIVLTTNNNEKLLEEKSLQINKLIGENIYSNGETLLERVCNSLITNNLKISFAESCTGGMLSSTLVGYPNISKVFDESYVSYSNSSKNIILGVKSSTIEKFGAVSKEVVEEMAIGLYDVSKSDICVSISGIAGPGGGTIEKPVGTVWMSIYYKNRCYTEKFNLRGNRNKIRTNAVNLTLFKVLKVIEINDM